MSNRNERDVLTEFLNSFTDYGPGLRQVAARGGRVASRHGPDRHRLSNKPFRNALINKRYQDMADKRWSLTDCASFLIMEEKRLTAALTHDRHFAQAGFQTLLR